MKIEKLPLNWIKCNFGDIAEIRNGYAFKSSNFKKFREKKSDIPVVKQSQLINDSVDLKNAVYLDHSFLHSHKNYMINKGDILIGMSGSIGKVCEYKFDYPALQNQRTGKITPISETHIYPKFFGLFLTNLERNLIEKSKGMGVQNISAEDIKSLTVYLPPTNEQHRIILQIEKLYSELDKGIEYFDLAVKQIKFYKQAIIKKAFEGKQSYEWRKNSNQYSNPTYEFQTDLKDAKKKFLNKQIEIWNETKRKNELNNFKISKPNQNSLFKQLPIISEQEIQSLPKLPETWSYYRLSDIAKIGSGISVSKARNLKNPEKIPYLRVANVQRGNLVLDEIKTMYFEKEKIDNYLLEKWDILFNEGGDRDKLGRGWIWESQIKKCITQNHVFRATTYIGGEEHAKFISYWGNTFGQEYFEKGGKQTVNLASINKTVLSMFPVPMPPLEEQKIIVKVLETKISNIDRFELDIKLSIKKAETLRQTILKRAFSGLLVNQDPKEESANEIIKFLKNRKSKKELK